MPARIVVAIADMDFADQLVGQLKRAGSNAAAFHNSKSALTALELAERIEVLVTSVDHPEGEPNGLALARMARARRPAVQVLFVGLPNQARYVAASGELVMLPATPAQVAARVCQLLASVDDPPEGHRTLQHDSPPPRADQDGKKGS